MQPTPYKLLVFVFLPLALHERRYELWILRYGFSLVEGAFFEFLVIDVS